MMREIENIYLNRFGVRIEKIASEEVWSKVEQIYKLNGSNIAYTYFIMDAIFVGVWRESL